MVRRYAQAPNGQRLTEARLAPLRQERHAGWFALARGIGAAMALEGATAKEVFETYVEGV
jgi:hypothetical protein